MEIEISNKNTEEFRNHVHALKGSSGSIGADQLHGICKEIMLDDAIEPDCISHLKRLTTSFHDTKLELQKYINHGLLKPSNCMNELTEHCSLDLVP